MKFTLPREALLKPLQALIGVVEKKQAMPILSNILVKIDGTSMQMTATDLEIELLAKVELTQSTDNGSITLPARKMFDICRNLPEQSMIEVNAEVIEKIIVKSGKSRFSLAGLPAQDFPTMESQLGQTIIETPQKIIAQLIKKTQFAMAQQDVRYFLNGLLIEISEKLIRTVATDGHRLALASEAIQGHAGVHQVIVPRKTILELQKILEPTEDVISLVFGTHFIRIIRKDIIITSKLVDGRYPDYNRVIPAAGKNILLSNRETLKQALQRTAILSTEKYRGVRLSVADHSLKLIANNPEQEEAEDEVEVTYVGQAVDIGFNITYLMDVLNVLDCENIKISFTNNVSSIVLQDPEDNRAIYVVMPIRL